ncbi:MAG: ABC transporter ATP-binding protein, partial [Acidobacteria bacterium]
MLSLSGVSKTYRGNSRPAVDSLNLAVPPGEIFGFLGPNGAGKTTTIKLIVGLLHADSGRITVSGADVATDPLAVKKRIGFVPDNPDLYERLTGLEYLNLLGDVFEVPGAVRKEKIRSLLRVFELEAAVADVIQSYSHGMRQKLVLIGALFHDPALFILDEPMVGLDPRSAHLFKQIMR